MLFFVCHRALALKHSVCLGRGTAIVGFDVTISRPVLENYLSRAITMEGLLNGRGDLKDNIRTLKAVGAKFIGRSHCLWGGEANLLRNLERAQQQVPRRILPIRISGLLGGDAMPVPAGKVHFIVSVTNVEFCLPKEAH